MKIPFHHNKPRNLLQVRINSPEEVIWEGTAEAVSSTNSQGIFDILPEHANFVTLINNQPILIKKYGSENLVFHFYYAVIHNENNTINIFAHV